MSTDALPVKTWTLGQLTVYKLHSPPAFHVSYCSHPCVLAMHYVNAGSTYIHLSDLSTVRLNGLCTKVKQLYNALFELHFAVLQCMWCSVSQTDPMDTCIIHMHAVIL